VRWSRPSRRHPKQILEGTVEALILSSRPTSSQSEDRIPESRVD
jgi:hypothetical protein